MPTRGHEALPVPDKLPVAARLQRDQHDMYTGWNTVVRARMTVRDSDYESTMYRSSKPGRHIYCTDRYTPTVRALEARARTNRRRRRTTATGSVAYGTVQCCVQCTTRKGTQRKKGFPHPAMLSHHSHASHTDGGGRLGGVRSVRQTRRLTGWALR
jgi:hypothetical protein